MRNIYSLIGAALMLLPFMTSAQQVRNCGTMDHQARIEAADPAIAFNRRQIEDFTRTYIENQSNKTDVVYTIPVVVHVVYYNTTQNISDAQIQSQITVLNQDFRRTNADASSTPSVWTSIAADCEINFCLATVDPNGAATTGITRTSTTVNGFTDNDAVKSNATGGKSAWDRTKYLNIWVCNLSGTLLGYAQFPGGPASTDGVVIDYQYFGTTGTATAPFNKGRTATHEVGHWLNLYHIWGDDGDCSGSDLVSDTPNQLIENTGCPTFPKTDACSPSSPGTMFMNYMDYTDDACMNLFTTGQKNRMQAVLATGGSRASLASSNGCGTTVGYCSSNGGSVAYEWINNVTFAGINNTTTGSAGGYANYTATTGTATKGSAYTLSVKPAFSSTVYTEYWKVYIDYNKDNDFADAGENVFTGTSTSTTAITGSVTIPTTATTGTTRMRVIMSDNSTINPCGTFSYGEVEDYSLTIQNATTCTDSYEANETSGTSKVISVNTNVLAKICTASDVDWYRFTTTSTSPKVKITLTTLPADYDVQLYNSSLTLLGTSQNSGTASEQIIFNSTTAATYYVKVYGYNGAFNTTTSYTLRASTQSANWRMAPGEDEFVKEYNKPAVVDASQPAVLFPNPANEMFTVSIYSAFEQPVTIDVMDMSGKVMETRNISALVGNTDMLFSTQHLDAGIYLVRILKDNSVETLRVSVTK